MYSIAPGQLSAEKQTRLQGIVGEAVAQGPNHRCECRIDERPWDQGAFAKDKHPTEEKSGDKKGNDSDSDTGVGKHQPPSTHQAKKKRRHPSLYMVSDMIFKERVSGRGIRRRGQTW